MKFNTFCAICASISSFVFGCLSAYQVVRTNDYMWVPFAIIGFFGAAVMWANRK